MNRAQSAIQFIPSDDRSTWIMVGMALRSEYGENARDIWMDWSRQADSFNESNARAVWRSFKKTGVSIASVFHEAKVNGWRDEGFQNPTREQIEARAQDSAERASKEGQEAIRLAKIAACKAKWIMDQCKPEKHAYLQMKGFPEAQGLVWRPDAETNLLCIPVYVGHDLSSVQMIDKHGVKKFLSNGITSGGEFCMDSGVINAADFWCEGYASGLSLRACLGAIKQPARIHVCFSAQNMKRMAHSGFVVGDNDKSRMGQEAASATGLPFWLPPVEGEDINDLWKREGTFRTSQVLRKWLQSGGAHG